MAEFDVLRAGETSAHVVYLDGTMVSDPEGDEVRFEFWSDLDGLHFYFATRIGADEYESDRHLSHLHRD